jgi:hypothetical protein
MMTEAQRQNIALIGLWTGILGIPIPIVVAIFAHYGVGTHGSPYSMPVSIMFGTTEVIAFGMGFIGRDRQMGQVGMGVSFVLMGIFVFLGFIRDYLMRGSNIMGF